MDLVDSELNVDAPASGGPKARDVNCRTPIVVIVLDDLAFVFLLWGWTPIRWYKPFPVQFASFVDGPARTRQ